MFCWHDLNILVGKSPPNPPEKAANKKLHGFVAEVDCIYNGIYTTAGTRVMAETESIPHFRRIET